MRSEWVVLYDGPEGLVIKDMNGPLSVTNDAEAVVAAVSVRLAGRRLFYFDSENRLDELLVASGQFVGFESGASDEVEEALELEGLLP